MIRLRTFPIVTVVWFLFVFNVERIQTNGTQLANFPNGLYLLVIFTSLIMLFLPDRVGQKFHSSLIALAVIAIYLVVRVVQELTTLGILDWLLVAEFAILLITWLLMYWLAGGLTDFETVVKRFLLNMEASRMLPRAEGEQKVDEELARARRFERPLALIFCVISARPSDPNERPQSSDSFELRFLQAETARAISELTYKSDIVVEYGEGLILCLPECDDAQAEAFAGELTTYIKTRLEVVPMIGIGLFPKDGAVFVDLARVAAKRARIWEGVDFAEDSQSTRQGSAFVDFGDRLRIEKEAEWVNRLAIQSTDQRAFYQPIKRLFDISMVVIALPLVLPVGLLVALLVYLDDPGPIFYMQDRTGYGGRTFKMMKFRSMYVNAKAIEPTKVVRPDGTVVYEWPAKTKNDPRITRVGRIIRKTSLDEMPQLINILRGDMSLVGPRPTTWKLERYTLLQTARLTVRPGLTGLWQVCAREATNFDERLLWDLKYIEKMSFWLDLKIMWLTVAQVFAKRGV